MFIIILSQNDFFISGYIVKLAQATIFITPDFNIFNVCVLVLSSYSNLGRGGQFFCDHIRHPFTQFVLDSK